MKGFRNLTVVMVISIVLIYVALVFQFRHAIKPLIVFAAIPYGVVGALAALWLMGSAFGFMAFLGIASLIGVIVSHVIVCSISSRSGTRRVSRSNRRCSTPESSG